MADVIKFPITVQCQTETCEQFKYTWRILAEDCAVSSRLTGLIKMPYLLCKGCGSEPVTINVNGSNLVE